MNARSDISEPFYGQTAGLHSTMGVVNDEEREK